ncbi:helix-turn-helix domain-containing protein [Flavitalea sp.]|nr:ImmA/IrrE family metallo-endopeptidase [Flavitalea sp.]
MRILNTEILALARESRGYNQNQLSDLLRVEQGTVSKIENGRLGITDELLVKIATILNYPVDLFYDVERVIKVEGHYRKKISLPAKELKEYKSKMTFAERHINKLSDAVELPDVKIPSWDVESDGDIIQAANFLREYWKIPRGRIEDLAKVTEDNGIIIAPLDLGDMDALSTYSSRYNLPILYVNKKRSADRIRFNNAHELCHYVCHFGKKISSERDIEKEANIFASELLLPTTEVLPQLVNLNLEKLSDLKRYWKVSMQAILYKAKFLNAVSENQYYYLVKQMSSLGYRKNEPIMIQPDNPNLLREILQTYIEDMSYSKTDLAKILYLNESDLESTYFGGRPTPKFNVYR